MGSWSTSEPSLPEGVSWSAEQKTGARKGDYCRAWAMVSVARGSGSTFYARYRVITKNEYDNSVQWQGYSVKLQITVAGNEETSSSGYDSTPHPYGQEKEVAVVYYTGSAAPGTSIGCNIYQGGSGTKTYFSAPAYVTSYTVTYNGNGADGGATESQSKLYNDSVTIRECGFVKEHFDFLEWNTAADGTGTRYMPGASYATNAALALYAVWEKATMPVYVSDGDGIYEADAVYVNADGEICECAVYVNIDGEIKEIV